MLVARALKNSQLADGETHTHSGRWLEIDDFENLKADNA
jgi:hypothetical protein